MAIRIYIGDLDLFFNNNFALIVKNKENITFGEKIKKYTSDIDIYNLDELKDIDFSKYNFFFYFPDSCINFKSSISALDISKIDKYQLFYNGIFYYKINSEALELCYILFGDDFLNYFDFNPTEQDIIKIVNTEVYQKSFVTIKTKDQVLENFNLFKKILGNINTNYFPVACKNFIEKHVYFSFIDCIDEATLKDYAISLLKDYIDFSKYRNETNVYSVNSIIFKDIETRFYNIYKYYIMPIKD